MAFHLGCMRALHQCGLLDQVAVLSTVSGGSVIGALYAANDESFEAFEERVRGHLKRGFVWPAVRKIFTTGEGLRALYCWLLVGVISLVLSAISLIGRLLTLIISASARQRWRLAPIHPPVPRFASRTTILQRVFDDELFDGKRLRDVPATRPLLIVNAADLRTGSAFYFSPTHSGSWRLGEVSGSDIKLSHAVTASAAYPLFLPALEERMAFNKRDGSRRVEHVSLSDGGVYDNLGLAPLWPDRDPDVSLNVVKADVIICCRAGYGPRFEPPSQFLISRLKSVFACALDRSQNAGIKRLFDLKDAGKLSGFALPFLGQDDSRLMFPPDDLVSREDTYDYPTDFSPMSNEWIDRLSMRGEQLTQALLKEHLPQLLAADS